MNLHKSNYNIMDKEILYSEYKISMNQIKSFDKETPYYVYAICDPTGYPIYIGKGKKARMFNHLTQFLSNKHQNKYLAAFLKSLGDEPPIMFLIQGNLSEKDALIKEMEYISEYGRFFEGGSLCNIMPGGAFSSDTMASIGGKMGGKITKMNGSGIFSSTYDRSKQTKENWEIGIMDHIDFHVIGKIGGDFAVENYIGIHNPIYTHKRTEWAKIGAKASLSTGPHGIFSEEWRKENKEVAHELHSKGGKIGGKVVGKMLWWNDGIVNKKANECPEGFVRGMLQSEKKKLSVLKNFNIKENYE